MFSVDRMVPPPPKHLRIRPEVFISSPKMESGGDYFAGFFGGKSDAPLIDAPSRRESDRGQKQ